MFELREAIQEFLREKDSELASKYNDRHWLTKLAYLTDIFSELNKINSSMQGRNANVLQLYEKLDAFVKKNVEMDGKSGKWQLGNVSFS